MLQNQGEDSCEPYRWAQAEYSQFERFVDIGRVVMGFSFVFFRQTCCKSSTLF
jgi:hypothetical protein